jgi:hypothetical protein
MSSTTIKVSIETRDRLREVSAGRPLENGILDALDSLEDARFWEQAERARAWRASLSPSKRAEIEADERAIDEMLDGGDWG